MAVKKSTTNFFKTSQTIIGGGLAKTQSLAVPEDKKTQRFMILCWIAMFVLLIILGVALTKLPKEIPLFYSKAWGREQLARPYFLFLPLLLSALFIFLNSYLSRKLRESTFLKKVLILGSGVATILAIITISRVLILLYF